MKFRLAFILLLSFVLLTVNLGSWGVTETSEARYAEISKEMLDNQDFVHPKLLNIHHYHKPPVTYYLTALGYKIFGTNEFGARFFLQIAIVLQLLLVYGIALLLFKKESVALAAILVYASIPIVLISSRNLTTDAYLNTSVLAAVYFWLRYKLDGLKPWHLYLFFLMLGLSFEIKGPVGWIFPLLFIGVYKWTQKDKAKLTVHHFLGMMLMLIVSFAWYIVVFSENQLLWNYFIEKQIANRIASKSFNRAKPFWFYLVTVPGIGLPWIFFLVHQSFKKFKGIAIKKSNEFVLLVSIVAIFIIFSIFKTKLILYILPMFGFVAVLMAKFLSDTKHRTLKVYNAVIVGILGLFVVGLAGINLFKTKFHFNTYYALIIAVIVIFISINILKRSFKKGFLKTTYLGYTLGLTILFSGSLFMAQNQTNLNSTKEVIAYIKNNVKDVDNIVVYNYLLPSAKFYSGKDIVTLNNGHNTVQRETQFETTDHWKPYNIDIRTESGKKQAEKLLSQKSVLIARGKHGLPKNLDYLTENLKHVKDFGNWIIYY